MSVTLIGGLEHQHAHESIVRRGHMDIAVVHVNFIDAPTADIHAMGL